MHPPGSPRSNAVSNYLSRFFETVLPPADVARVEISSSGQSGVDFEDVMKTQRFRDDLEALRRIASLHEVAKG